MYKLILLIAIFSLAACSADGMKSVDKSPRGIKIINITYEERSKAYRAAEKHCAKYYKVPRVLKSANQGQGNELQAPANSMIFECLKPSN